MRTKFQHVKCILLDIEGTVSDVRFVYDVMFPYAKSRMSDFLLGSWDLEEVQAAIAQVATDADPLNSPMKNEWNARSREGHPQLMEHLNELMASDSKSTGLKMLQGLVWKSGFESGAIQAELFADVLPALTRWNESGFQLAIYSSGSVLAQKLFFGHTTSGDVTSLLRGYFDTTIGKKQEADSYRRIAEKIGFSPDNFLFVSDVAQELVAAAAAGMQVVASVRPNNKPLESIYAGPAVQTFDEIDVTID